LINSKKFDEIKDIYYSKYFIWAIIIIGVLIRFRQYLFNRSLWIDEASLALNILKLNYSDLLTPLLHSQAAPPFFLLITKLFTDIAGYSEYVLRFLPFICGIASLLLFYHLAIHFLQKKVIPIAICLLSFSYYAIYYSVEFKQYSADLLFTILLILFAFKLDESKYNKKYSMYFGVMAILSTWFSHTSVFVLAGVGCALLYKIFFGKGNFDKTNINITHLKELLTIGILSITSFAFHYFFIIRPVPKGYFYEFWENSFIPFPPLGLFEIRWYLTKGINILKNPLGFTFLYGIAFIFAVIGMINFWKRKDKIYLNLLLFPIVFLLIASILHIYPINGRLILFILPIMYLFISEGIYQFIKYFYPNKRLVALLIVIFLLLYPVLNGISYLIRPILKQEIKPVIKYCLENKEESDKIYLYAGAKPAFEYYTWNNKIDTLNSVDYSWETPEEYLKDLDRLRGEGRVWFIFSNIVRNDDKLYLTYLDYIATQLDFFETKGTSVYLYEIL
jgi:hypothetical protein